MFVYNNEDGTYDVVTLKFDQPAADSTAARKLVAKYNEFTESSPHALLVAVALGGGPLLSARIGGTCHVPDCPKGCGTGTVPEADGPVLCETFDRLCTCSICYATGLKGGKCDDCKLDP